MKRSLRCDRAIDTIRGGIVARIEAEMPVTVRAA